MGITGLGPYLRKTVPESYKTVSLSTYANKRIAVDISLFLYKYKIVFGEDGWLSAMVNLATSLRKWKIHPVIVYDGVAPKEKIEEQKQRREALKSRENNVDIVRSMVETYKQDGIIPEELQAFYDKHKKSVENQSLKKLLGKSVEVSFDIKVVEDKLESLDAQNVRPTQEDTILSMEMFKILGIPCIQAPNEAEAYCSYMCVLGLADGVLSEDTDVLVYGTNKLLTKINTQASTVVEIDLNVVLDGMELDLSQFKDFCILIGCDYNSRPKGYGPVKSHKMIKEHKSIDAIEQLPKENIESSKYVRTRELFEVPPELDYTYTMCVSPDKVLMETFLFENHYKGHSKGVYLSCVSEEEPLKDKITPNKIPSTYVPRKSPSKSPSKTMKRKKLLPTK